MTDDNSGGLNRRKFMKRAATTGAISFGVAATSTTTAAAVPVSANRAESLLDAHADGVLSLLEADGVLADRRDLPTAIENDVRGITGGSEGTAMFALPDRAEELKVVKSVDDGTLTVTVQPDSNRAFAILDTGEGKVAYNVENGRYDFGTADHDCGCMNHICDSSPTTCLEECCGGGSCHYSCECAC